MTEPDRTAAPPRAPTGARRHDLDWVRALAILSVVIYHAAQVFTGDAAATNAADRSTALREFCFFFHQWRMPLVFCIAGTAAGIVRTRRTGGAFLVDRARRLLVPLAFGVLVLLPPQLYLATHDPRPFAEFYPHFLDPMLAGPVVRWGHLWFIVDLALAEVVALPVALFLRGLTRPRLDRLAERLAHPAVLLGAALPLAAVRCIPTRWVGDWTVAGLTPAKPFAVHLAFYVCGVLLALSDAPWKTAVRERRAALTLAVAAQAAVYVLRGLAAGGADTAAPAARAFDFAVGVAGWLWIVALFGYAHRYLRTETAALRYLRDATYPVYLVHYTIVMVAAAPFAHAAGWIGARFVALALVALGGSLAGYELLRRVDATRFLVGLRPLRALRVNGEPRPATAPAKAARRAA